ncbi:TadE/TadG family type IV pilus assembly protein [Ruegeria sp. ANG-S4]|uniref:TadE/TadG family type IV pilus assembly protein n=1 Tax=Ruegeria sp. ANG-S4 TaxID=1577904 RepID=UPI00068E010F|nr:TadE family protein [Ruegeria sp. ANG-S4]
MIRSLKTQLRRFRRSEDGSASTIEFLFWFPVFVYFAWSGIDLGLMSFSHANLERSLDETVREVRLNRLPEGEDEWDHELLKDMICQGFNSSPSCLRDLSLEMKSIDPRVGNEINETPFCVDTPVEVRDPDPEGPGAIAFDQGSSNELMMLRACLEVSPVWGFTMIGGPVSQDPAGQWELHATTVFVHEPFGGGSDDSENSTAVEVADAGD